MLNAVTQALKDAGLLNPGAAVTSNMLFKGNIIYLNIHSSDGNYYHVRVSNCQNLEIEFSANLDAARRYPRLAPFPLGCGIAEGAWWIAYEGIHLHPIMSEQLIRAKPRSAIHDGVLAYFRESRRQSATIAPSPEEFEDFCHSRIISCEIPESIARNACSLYTSLGIKSLPATLQHCDLAINNLAISDKKLVIFDWEDFGKVGVPGFDLAVLFASALHFEPSAMRLAANNSVYASKRCIGWLAPACEIIGIQTPLFLQALPLYMLMFLQLKAPPYSQSVRDRVRAALVALA